MLSYARYHFILCYIAGNIFHDLVIVQNGKNINIVIVIFFPFFALKKFTKYHTL